MSLEVRIWRSFSPNNSSSCYLVARFAEVPAARACAAELRRYLAANAAELAAMTWPERRANRDLTLANLELSESLGFAWPAYLVRGDADIGELELAALDRAVVMYHDYCLGFDDALTRYIESRGGHVATERWNALPAVSVMVFEPAHPVVAEIAAFFAAERSPQLLASFHATGAAGFAGALPVADLEALGSLLDGHAGADLEIAVDRPGDVDRFRCIDAARCVGCGAGELDFLPAGRAAVPDDQLACHRCGAMFSLDAVEMETT